MDPSMNNKRQKTTHPEGENVVNEEIENKMEDEWKKEEEDNVEEEVTPCTVLKDDPDDLEIQHKMRTVTQLFLEDVGNYCTSFYNEMMRGVDEHLGQQEVLLTSMQDLFQQRRDVQSEVEKSFHLTDGLHRTLRPAGSWE